jgi:ATP-binding cassette subfamily B multidrug efflux pump
MILEKIKPYLPYMLRYRRDITIGIVALLFADLAGLSIPWLLKMVVDELPNSPSDLDLLGFGGILLVIATVQAISRFGWRQYLFGPSRKVEFDISNHLFSHFLSLDKSWFQRQKIGDLMSRATNDLRAVRDFVGLGFLILVDCTVIIVSCVGLMLWINPSLTLVVLIPLPALSILFWKYLPEIGLRHEIVQKHLSKITSHVQENLSGIRVIHAFAQEEAEKKKFDELNKAYIHKNLSVTRLFGVFTPALSLTVGLAAMISLWVGGEAVIAKEMSLGSFVAFNGYLLMLSWPMMGIGFIVNLTQKGQAAMGRIQEIFLAKSDIVDDEKTVNSICEFRGDIEFRDLTFSYPETDKPSLQSIKLKIPSGQILAVVGVIGSGKSSLVQLIPRLYEVDEETLFIGGHSIRKIPLSVLRQNIGYVDQEPYLFSATLRENIIFGRDEASNDAIDDVVRKSGLLTDLNRFSDGLETIIGERGVSLSGGQIQRVALARSLLLRPKILVLDDAFSSLDAETEDNILKNIREFTSGITTVMVSHRLTAVRKADRIILINDGQILEDGTHDELLNLDGKYAQTYKNQALAMEMEITLQ